MVHIFHFYNLSQICQLIDFKGAIVTIIWLPNWKTLSHAAFAEPYPQLNGPHNCMYHIYFSHTQVILDHGPEYISLEDAEDDMGTGIHCIAGNLVAIKFGLFTLKKIWRMDKLSQ